MFTAEEPTRFALGCLGSRVLAGVVSDDRLAGLRDADGISLDAARAAAGVTGSIAEARLAARAPTRPSSSSTSSRARDLERDGVPIGVVTAIAAPATLRVELSGEGGHAGAVLMPLRHDPLVAAAEVVLAVDREARGSGAPGHRGHDRAADASSRGPSTASRAGCGWTSTSATPTSPAATPCSSACARRPDAASRRTGSATTRRS